MPDYRQTKIIGEKRHTLIEANVDVMTTDGYLLRVFCIGFTKQLPKNKTAYAQASQCRAIRRKMVDILTREIHHVNRKEAVNKLIPDSIEKDIEKKCQSIFSLENVCIRKVKVLKKP